MNRARLNEFADALGVDPVYLERDFVLTAIIRRIAAGQLRDQLVAALQGVVVAAPFGGSTTGSADLLKAVQRWDEVIGEPTKPYGAYGSAAFIEASKEFLSAERACRQAVTQTAKAMITSRQFGELEAAMAAERTRLSRRAGKSAGGRAPISCRRWLHARRDDVPRRQER
jgi:hypothetical protein